MSRKRLREMLMKPGIIKSPGAFDAWSAKLVELAGFSAVYMTGYGVSASVIGKPDIGLLTMTEMVTAVKNITNAVEISLIADADNGYGNVMNVIRTVQEYEKAGAAAIQLEDQVLPKRCGHMEGKQLISSDEMITKIRAAACARESEDLVIIARTDARAVNGFEDAIRRCQSYVEAGADVIFFEAPRSIDEMKAVGKLVKAPLLANMVEHGKTPFLTGKELEEMGFKIAIYPVSALYAATKAMQEILNDLKVNDTTKPSLDNMVKFPEFNELIGLNRIRDFEKEICE